MKIIDHKFSQLLLRRFRIFADSIQRPHVDTIPLSIEEVNERKLNHGPLYEKLK